MRKKKRERERESFFYISPQPDQPQWPFQLLTLSLCLSLSLCFSAHSSSKLHISGYLSFPKNREGMGRAPCCDKANVKRGPWSPEEDAALRRYVQLHGTGGNWIALPQKAGLKRCGKSCRLRWLNYLRPDIKHGGFTEEEDSIIFSLYKSIGSRWSVIASKLPGRTDNDVKNYWNTKLKKKIIAAGETARPVTSLHYQPPSPASPAPANPPRVKAEALLPALPDSTLCYAFEPYQLPPELPHELPATAGSGEYLLSPAASDELFFFPGDPFLFEDGYSYWSDLLGSFSASCSQQTLTALWANNYS